jgi:hypothetical protein
MGEPLRLDVIRPVASITSQRPVDACSIPAFVALNGQHLDSFSQWHL